MGYIDEVCYHTEEQLERRNDAIKRLSKKGVYDAGVYDIIVNEFKYTTAGYYVVLLFSHGCAFADEVLHKVQQECAEEGLAVFFAA